MIKRGLLNIGGFITYVGAPLIPVAMYWDFFVSTDAKTTLSTIVLFVLIVGLSVTKFIFKGDKLPIKPNMFWVVFTAVILVLTPIMSKLLMVGFYGIGGSALGSVAFKRSNKLLEASNRAKLVQETAERVKENENVQEAI